MPLDLDFLTQIVNVSWGGGAIIVVKTLNSDIHCGNIDNATEEAVAAGKWTFVGSPFAIDGGAFSNNGASYALIDKGADKKEDVFLLSAVNEDHDGNTGGVILFSTNGIDWKIVFSQYEVNSGDIRDPWFFEPTGIVWDDVEQAFYASFYVARFDQPEVGSAVVTEGESIHRSTDGRTWTRVSYDLKPQGFLTENSPSLLVPHCIKPENKGHIPDGLQAYNKSSGLFMKPTSLIGSNIFNGAAYNPSHASSVDIKYDHPDAEKKDRTVSVSFPCYAVAQTNGIWIATGGIDVVKVAVSVDDGVTWTTVRTKGEIDKGWGVCVVAASIE